MRPLHHDPHFTFRFAGDRLISRFHLEGMEAGQQVSVFRINPGTGDPGLLAKATVGNGGWVNLPKPISVQAGEGFIVVPQVGSLKLSPGRMVFYGICLVGVLALFGYFCGLAQGSANALFLACACAAAGAFVVLLGYGP
jgi:hypothetical protein